MTHRDNSYGDLLAEQNDAQRAHLIRDLDVTLRMAPPAPVRASIARALDEHARALAANPAHQDTRRHRPRIGARWHRGWVSVAAALVLAVGSVAGYLTAQAPATAAASAILRHALAARPPATPSQVIHQTGSLYVNGPFDLPDQKLFTSPMTVAVEQWTQLDASGAISRQVTTMTDGTGARVAQGLQIGTRAQIYGTLQNAISTRTTAPDQNYAWLANPLGITDIPALLVAAQASSSDRVRLLPQQTVGSSVTDVVQVRTIMGASDTFPHAVGTAGVDAQLTTMYVDARTYAIRGVDVATTDSKGVTTLHYSMRVSRFEIVPQEKVPAGVFALDAPPTARHLPSWQPASDGHAAPPSAPLPTLLLSRMPPGVQLGELHEDVGPVYAATSITYCGTGRCHDLPPTATQFVISFAQTQPPSTQVPPALADGQVVTLAVAGRTEQAHDVEESAPLGARRLIYQDGQTTVELYCQGLSRADFFAAVSALVDAQAHPELIPAKWRAMGAFGHVG